MLILEIHVNKTNKVSILKFLFLHMVKDNYVTKLTISRISHMQN